MKLGIIGGSGLYDIEGLSDIENITVGTPFGDPSGALVSGRIEGKDIVFLPRHGAGHTIMPSDVNHKANIFAMKKIGVTHIVSVSAVGSLKENIRPRDILTVDQYFDRTKQGAKHTFFGEGLAGHIPFGEPVCPELRALAYAAATEIVDGGKDSSTPQVHPKGTYVNIEGPAFSTKAESAIYRQWGLDVIGMTNLAEAKLSREAEICYATVAMITDYDAWHPDHEHVSVEMVIQNLIANTEFAKALIKKLANMIDNLEQQCSCTNVLQNCIITSPDFIKSESVEKLNPILGKYF